MKGLLEEHEDIFREMIPEDSPDASIGLVDPTAQHKIPLIDGAVPVKMRPYAMSAAEMENFNFTNSIAGPDRERLY